MAKITDGILPDGLTLGVVPDRYQELLMLPEAAFNGLNKPDDEKKYACEDIWTQSARNNLAIYLSMSEERREQELGYHIDKKYVSNEEHPYTSPLILNKKHLISIGDKTTTTISAGVALDHGVETDPNDPVIITVTTTVTSTSEIKIVYPGESVEIRPFSVSIAGGTATIKIPRSRLVLPSLNDDRSDSLKYYENDNFLTTVDVKRVYIDSNAGLLLVWTSEDRVICGEITHPDGSESTQQALSYIDDKRLSIIRLYPGSSNEGAAYAKCILPSIVRVNYMSGRTTSMKAEIETIRLSHVMMPYCPSACEAVQQYWQRDGEDDPSGLVTPYGSTRGAVEAWLADSRAKVGHGGKF